MVKVTPSIIDSISKKDEKFRVPKELAAVIGDCILNSDVALLHNEYLKLQEAYKKYRKSMKPIHIDYSNNLTLDAYIVYYLARNSIIPSIAIRDLAYHSVFQEIPNHLRILDLGSGSGAIVIGLLDLFNRKPLNNITINIVALDSCAEALKRQSCLIEKAGLNPELVQHHVANLQVVDDTIELAKREGPYNIIFLANCLTELEPSKTMELISKLPPLLATNGAIIIAEPQRNYIKKMISSLVKETEKIGLYVYYPCPNGANCTNNRCWVWRDHDYDYPSIKLKGKDLVALPKEKLTLSWLILTSEKVSIYDHFKSLRSDLSWRPIAKVRSIKKAPDINWDYGICDGHQYIDIKGEKRSWFCKYPRGSIVGLDDNLDVVDCHVL